MTQRTLNSGSLSTVEQSEVLYVQRLCVTLGKREILNDLDLSLRVGDSVAVTGRSGSGKSTLLATILGMQRFGSGDIQVLGESIHYRSKSAAKVRRNHIGVIFQSGELLPEISPLENVVVAGLLAGQEQNHCRRLAAELLEQLNVPNELRPVAEFSGGEQQRVAVARALVTSPQLLVADEPTGSLDPETRDQVLEVIFSLPTRFQCALLIVTHDPVAARMADRHLALDGSGNLRRVTSNAR